MRGTPVLLVLAVLLAACDGREPFTIERSSASAAVTEAPAFAFSARRLPASVRKRVVGSSWREGCPVALGRLRYLRVGYRDFRGRERRGELIVHQDAVRAMRSAFGALWERELPVRRMRLVDDYGASDFRSIEADNTSAFNCRRVAGTTRWSEHAYGRAIDVNPIENPYVSANGTTVHVRSRPYLDRSRVRPGMATRRGRLVRAFADAGWSWGGRWSPARDYQHFSASGR